MTTTTPTDPCALLTIPDASEILRCSTRKVATLVSDGLIRSIKIGRHRRITRQAVTDFIASLESAEPTPA